MWHSEKKRPTTSVTVHSPNKSNNLYQYHRLGKLTFYLRIHTCEIVRKRVKMNDSRKKKINPTLLMTHEIARKKVFFFIKFNVEKYTKIYN